MATPINMTVIKSVVIKRIAIAFFAFREHSGDIKRHIIVNITSKSGKNNLKLKNISHIMVIKDINSRILSVLGDGLLKY